MIFLWAWLEQMFLMAARVQIYSLVEMTQINLVAGKAQIICMVEMAQTH